MEGTGIHGVGRPRVGAMAGNGYGGSVRREWPAYSPSVGDGADGYGQIYIAAVFETLISEKR